MDKKASLQLGVNAIIILIIALAVMGLVIGFVSGKFQDLTKKAEVSQPPGEVSAEKPIGVPGGGSKFRMEHDADNELKMRFRNPTTGKHIKGLIFKCADAKGSGSNAVKATGGEGISAVFDVPPSETKLVTATINVGSDWELGKHSCAIYGTKNSAPGTDPSNSDNIISRSVFVEIE